MFKIQQKKKQTILLKVKLIKTEKIKRLVAFITTKGNNIVYTCCEFQTILIHTSKNHTEETKKHTQFKLKQ